MGVEVLTKPPHEDRSGLVRVKVVRFKTVFGEQPSYCFTFRQIQMELYDVGEYVFLGWQFRDDDPRRKAGDGGAKTELDEDELLHINPTQKDREHEFGPSDLLIFM